ncbi:hypothetical protein IE53DRAFT_363204 [Violaceomyces palustris]|uniref:Uncharacterized protein n=1 Tax=Violaceomyces palustris TaxID=1673888 RepID=A0ACD0NU70_9BASI|nr:hypothetical protein IE53DRAFT_363204 [Violaceomyces palustris]
MRISTAHSKLIGLSAIFCLATTVNAAPSIENIEARGDDSRPSWGTLGAGAAINAFFSNNNQNNTDPSVLEHYQEAINRPNGTISVNATTLNTYQVGRNEPDSFNDYGWRTDVVEATIPGQVVGGQQQAKTASLSYLYPSASTVQRMREDNLTMCISFYSRFAGKYNKAAIKNPKGDCTKILSRQCVQDLMTMLASNARGQVSEYNPCLRPILTPKSCEDSGQSAYGEIGTFTKTVESLEQDGTGRTFMTTWSSDRVHDVSDHSFYDARFKQLYMFSTTEFYNVSQNDATVSSSDEENTTVRVSLTCHVPNVYSEGSRVSASTRSFGSIMGSTMVLAGLAVLASILLF